MVGGHTQSTLLWHQNSSHNTSELHEIFDLLSWRLLNFERAGRVKLVRFGHQFFLLTIAPNLGQERFSV